MQGLAILLVAFSCVAALSPNVSHVAIEPDHVAAKKATPWHKDDLSASSNGTTTTTTTSMPSLRHTIQNDLHILKEEITIIREDVSKWMEQPYTQEVLIPAIVGSTAAILTAILLCAINIFLKRCRSRRVRSRINILKSELAGDDQKLLKRKDSDNDW